MARRQGTEGLSERRKFSCRSFPNESARSVFKAPSRNSYCLYGGHGTVRLRIRNASYRYDFGGGYGSQSSHAHAGIRVRPGSPAKRHGQMRVIKASFGRHGLRQDPSPGRTGSGRCPTGQGQSPVGKRPSRDATIPASHRSAAPQGRNRRPHFFKRHRHVKGRL